MKHFYIIENKETFFDKNPAINMAIDEMLFEFLKKESTKIGFIIRFYTWENSYLSFGYTQRIKKKLELLKKFSNNKTQNFVRRPTGGGFVEHGNDICIAIVSNINLFPKLKKLDYSYNLIHSLILKAIKNLKKDDTDFSSMILYNSNDETININSKNQKYNFCFEKPVLNDIMLKDIKIVGSAQKRVVDKNITYLLQQTSINIKSLFKKEISSDFILKISNFIIKEFEKALKINFENYNYSKKNLEKIDYLLKNKYLLDSWNKKI